MDAYIYRKREYWIIMAISADEENKIWSKNFSPVSVTHFHDNDD